MVDLEAADARHDAAVEVGQKMKTWPSVPDRVELATLFACCSDIPELLEEVRKLRAGLAEAESVIVRSQTALGTDHPVWLMLDDYDGSMDSVKAMLEVVRAAQELVGDWKANRSTHGGHLRTAVEKYEAPWSPVMPSPTNRVA